MLMTEKNTYQILHAICIQKLSDEKNIENEIESET